jgi:hypothetical protein
MSDGIPAGRHRQLTAPAPFVGALGKLLAILRALTSSAHLVWLTDFATTVT